MDVTAVAPAPLQLVDPTALQVRAICPDDAEALVAFHEGLSPETVYLRFFTVHPHLSPAEVERLTHVDGADRLALVALFDSTLVGVARYERSVTEPTAAEVAFVVADRFQGHGIGSMLLHRLAAYAVGAGIGTFSAVTLLENHSMQEVFRHSGFPYRGRFDRGLVEYRLDIRPG